jgi:glycerol-3-phosphate dehydrogenase
LRGALLSYDGQLVDDARLVVAIARTAAGHGARIITRARVNSLDGNGASVTDEAGGHRMRVRARAVVNATGVWAGELVPEIELRPSRGSHLVLDARTVRIGHTSLTIPIPGSSNRFALLLPQLEDRIYLGLTDEPLDGPIPDVPEVPESDVQMLLEVASSALEVPLHRDDVRGAFAGLRPLVAAPDGAEVGSADLSRRHLVHTGADGVISVVGGKLTTYRRMAADAVDAAVAAAGLRSPACRTKLLGLVGAAPRVDLSTVDAPARLVARYGTEAPAVARLGDSPVGGSGLTDGEVVWAVQHEGALSADDVLDRRSRVGLVAADREEALEPVREIVARTLESPVC